MHSINTHPSCGCFGFRENKYLCLAFPFRCAYPKMYLCISARNRDLASFWANKKLGWFAYFVLGRLNKGAYHSVVYKRVHAHNNRTRREKESEGKKNK